MAARYDTAPEMTIDTAGRYAAVLHTPQGDITLRLLPEVAPQSVNSFVFLAREGFYDGVTFHRVIPGFVAQAGDPTGTGSGGPGYKLPAEFNEIEHVPGVLSMARTSDPHSAGSQFFLCTDDCPNLDNQYTVFGRVIDGLDTVMKIGESERNAGKFHMQKVEVFTE